MGIDAGTRYRVYFTIIQYVHFTVYRTRVYPVKVYFTYKCTVSNFVPNTGYTAYCTAGSYPMSYHEEIKV